MNKILIYITICLLLLTLFILFYFNFISIYNFRLFKDYIKLEENICDASKGPKFEADIKRYKLANFFFKNFQDLSYFQIQNDFKNSFFVLVSFYSILCIVITIIMRSYILSIYEVFLALLIVYITYTTVNSIIVQNFDAITQEKNNEESNIRIYYKLYKILNAFLIVSNIMDCNTKDSTNEGSQMIIQCDSKEKYQDTFEYMYDRLNYKIRTFDDILSKHISSHYNESNSSKVLTLKNRAIQDLDFAKFLVFDKMSPYYLKYFDNMYIINVSDYDYPDKVYLQDIHNKSDIKYSDVHRKIKELNSKISDDETREEYIHIKQLIKNFDFDEDNLSVQYSNVLNIISNIDLELSKDKQLQPYNPNLYNAVKQDFNTIKTLLLSEKSKEIYQYINKKIKKLLEYDKIEVENDDYLQFFFVNKELIINEHDNTTKMYVEILNRIDYITDYIYAYIVFIIIICFTIMHYIYVNFGHYQYIAVVAGVISLFTTVMYFYTKFKK